MIAKTAKEWDNRAIYFQYLNDVSKYPLLTRTEEQELLARIARGDKRALDKLVTANLKFVINIANLYKGQGLDVNELINEGNVGLIEAARRFDTSRDLKFISYGVWWIRQSITRAIAEKARVVRISAEKELILRRFSKVNHPMTQSVGGAWVTDTEELGRRMGMSADAVEKIVEMGQRHSRLDSKLDEDGDSNLLDMLHDEEAVLPDEHAEGIDELENLQEMIAELPPQERRVLCMYFGIGYGEACKLLEIGKIVGLSKERVRQLEAAAFAKMRRSLENQTREVRHFLG